MRIEAHREELLSVVKGILPFVERKSTIPILTNLLLMAEADRVAITGTDLENSLTVTKLGWKVEGEGRITVSARQLLGCLEKMDTAEVALEGGENHWLAVTCGPLTAKLPGMDAKNYPALAKFPEGGDTVCLPGDVLAGLITRTSYAVSDGESRYTLNAVLLLAGEGKVEMIATDGHRLAIAAHSVDHPTVAARTLVRSSTLDRLDKLVRGADTVTVTQSDNNLFFRSGEWEMVGRKVTGQFPNYEAVLPKDNSQRVTLSGKALAASLARVAQFADERSRAVRFDLVLGVGVRLSAHSTEAGEAVETVPGDCSGEGYVGFSADYVLDILKVLGKDQTITLAIRNAQSSALWTPTEANGWDTKCVLMPMRL